MAVSDNHYVPGRNEPDSRNIRQRSFQGGADGIPDAYQAGGGPTSVTYGDIRYEDGEGPAAGADMTGGTGSGLSGMPQATAGNIPPLWDDPTSAPAPSKPQKR